MFRIILIKFDTGTKISILFAQFIFLRILLLLCAWKRDAVSGSLATQHASLAGFRRFVRHATSFHRLPSNHTIFHTLPISHIALWRDVYKRN